MDEKLISGAAMAAVNNLQLDCQVASVYRRKDAWCIKFSGSYGEFCDEFRSRYGEENSTEVVREKIKRYLLKSPKPTGRRRGASRRTINTGPANSLLDLPLQIVGGALEQTARLAGDVINGALKAAESALNTVEEAATAAAQAVVESPELQTSIRIAASERVLSSTDETSPPTIKLDTKKATKSVTKTTMKGATKSASKASKKAARKTSRKKAQERKS